MHVIALGAGQSLFCVHGMVHSFFVICAKPSHSPDAQDEAPVHAVQSCASAAPSPPPPASLAPLDEPLLLPAPLLLPEPLLLPAPLLLPELLPELLPLLLPLELPLLDPEPLLDPLSASPPELEPLSVGPEDEELEQAGTPRMNSVEPARAKVRTSFMRQG